MRRLFFIAYMNSIKDMSCLAVLTESVKKDAIANDCHGRILTKSRDGNHASKRRRPYLAIGYDPIAANTDASIDAVVKCSSNEILHSRGDADACTHLFLSFFFAFFLEESICLVTLNENI